MPATIRKYIIGFSFKQSNPPAQRPVKKAGETTGECYALFNQTQTSFFINRNYMQAGDKKTGMHSEDIDLLLLIERSVLFFKTYKWLFIFAIVAGLAAGTYFYLSIPRVYKSRLLLHSSILSNPEEIQIIQTWNEFLNKRQYKTLAEAFQCKVDMLTRVRNLKASEIEKIFVPDNPNGFVIEATVSDNTIWKELQRGIVYGLSNTEYARDKAFVRKVNLVDLIEKSEKELLQLDSTKQKIEKIISGEAKGASSVVIDGGGFYRQSMEMQSKLMGYKEDLKFSDPVQVLTGFTASEQPESPSRIVWLFMGVVVFLCIAYVIALLNSINRKLKIRSRNRNAT